MKLPVVIVNFKTYKEATGEKAVTLAKICEKVAKETGKNIIAAVQAADIYRVSKAVKIPVFAQHICEAKQGQSTGAVTAESVKDAGASGTLVNHSEHRIGKERIGKIIIRAKKLGLTTILCAKDAEEAKELDSMKPDFIAVEPPELIGGNISVSTAKPEVISKSVEMVKGKRVIVGAGVKTKKDVEKAASLGSIGILVASGVVKAKDPEKELRALAEGFS
jgi:triosephosphate isomerase (TIM)